MQIVSTKLLAWSLAAALAPQLLTAQTASSDPSSQAGQSSGKSSSQRATQDIRASKLIGSDLKASDGTDLGEIRDVVVDPQTGKINFAIIGIAAGNGTEALAPIPWQAVKLRSEKDYVASIDQNKLKSGPTLSQQQWDQLAQPDYTIRIYRFYGFEPPAAGGADQSQGLGGSSGGTGQQTPEGQ